MPYRYNIPEAEVPPGLSDVLAAREDRRRELKDWRALLTEEQRHNLSFAVIYATHFGDRGLADGHLLVLISELRDLLDSAVSYLR